MTVATVAVVLVVLLAFWVVGGVVLRITGVVLALVALGTAVAGTGAAMALLLAVVAALLWLAGHWHFALRHHRYKSPLARRVFLQVLPHRLDPTRNWGVQVVHTPRQQGPPTRR